MTRKRRRFRILRGRDACLPMGWMDGGVPCATYLLGVWDFDCQSSKVDRMKYSGGSTWGYLQELDVKSAFEGPFSATSVCFLIYQSDIHST